MATKRDAEDPYGRSPGNCSNMSAKIDPAERSGKPLESFKSLLRRARTPGTSKRRDALQRAGHGRVQRAGREKPSEISLSTSLRAEYYVISAQ